MRRAQHIDERNYDKEAHNLVKDLASSELYKLYEIVCEQQKKRQSAERYKELSAVQKAIERTKGIDYGFLKNILEGYKSNMAQEAHGGDLIKNQKKNSKKQK